jgi:hypothetical protein
MRRSLVLALVTATLAATGTLTLTTSAGAGEEPGMTTIIVRKNVVGTGTGGSTVRLDCSDDGDTVDLNFDAAGHPTTSVPADGSISIVGGAWQISSGNPPNEPVPCTFTEITTGGASFTGWTCAYSFTAPESEPAPPAPAALGIPAVVLGCMDPLGVGTGPATVTYGNSVQDIETQTSTVTFTNVFPRAEAGVVDDPVVVAPAFTG